MHHFPLPDTTAPDGQDRQGCQMRREGVEDGFVAHQKKGYGIFARHQGKCVARLARIRNTSIPTLGTPNVTPSTTPQFYSPQIRWHRNEPPFLLRCTACERGVCTPSTPSTPSTPNNVSEAQVDTPSLLTKVAEFTEERTRPIQVK